MFRKTAPILLLGSALLAVPVAAIAQDSSKGGGKGVTTVVPTAGSSGKLSPEGLVDHYKGITGSEANARSLVNGLHSGDPITLVGPPPPLAPRPPLALKPGMKPPPPPPAPKPITVTFTPPTGKMGWGNVDISLTLMEAVLTHNNVSKPSPTQLFGVLMTNPGILQLRAGGMGWGQIANELGFELK